MQSILILRYAVRSLVLNPLEVARIFAFPYLLIFSLVGSVGFYWGLFDDFLKGNSMEHSAGFGAMFGVLSISFIIALWPVVNWHRFVLADEAESRFIARIQFECVFDYFLRIILIVFASVLVATPLILLGNYGVSYVAASKQNLDFAIGFTIQATHVLNFVSDILIAYFILRLSISLVGVALGEDQSGLRTIWRATKEGRYTILGIAFALLCFQALSDWGIDLLPERAAIPFGILSFAILGLLNVSILTTLYGHYVEGRELS